MLQRLAFLALAASCAGGVEQPAPGCDATLGARAFRQPRITLTNDPLDVAIVGPGFFELSDRGSTVFTRVGHFNLDPEGWLVGPGQYRLVGEPLGTARVGELRIEPRVLAPIATQTVSIVANLDADAPLKVFDLADPVTTSNAQSSVVLFDEAGRSSFVDLFWTHTAAGKWEFHALCDGANVAGGTIGVPTQIGAGTLDFDTHGRLVRQAQASQPSWVNSAAPTPLFFALGDPTSTGGTGLAGVTQFAGPSATLFTGSDGAPAGLLEFVVFEPSGRLVGHFSNGLTLEYGRVLAATFDHPDALLQAHDDLVLSTLGSGAPTLGPGKFVGSALEESAACP